MNWDCIAGSWRRFKRRAWQRWRRPTDVDPATAVADEASKKQLAEWAVGRHDTDPIHK